MYVSVTQMKGSSVQEHRMQFKIGQVCLLNKALYGLKQTPRKWNQKFDGFMAELNFVRSYRDSCVYVKMVQRFTC